MKVYDFRKYRSVGFMAIAMINELRAKRTRRNRMRAACPKSCCKSCGEKSLIWSYEWPVAYCFGCHSSIDALEIVRLNRGCDYFTAANWLDSMTIPVDE